MKLIQCSGIPYIYGWLEEGEHLFLVCTLSEKMSSLWNLHLIHRGLFYERPIIQLDGTIGGVDLPLHQPIWALTVEMWNHHWNCHSDALSDLPGGLDLPVDLPIWALTVKIWNCHSDPLADLPVGVGRPIWTYFTFHALLHRRSFRLYERPISYSYKCKIQMEK